MILPELRLPKSPPSPTTRSLLRCRKAITHPALTAWYESFWASAVPTITPPTTPTPARRPHFGDWRRQGVFVQDSQPSLYRYTQQFPAAGGKGQLERHGFIALGKVEDYAAGVVFRHEQTLAKPKADRLDLLRATRAHFGQIFMLYSDPAAEIENCADLSGPAAHGNDR